MTKAVKPAPIALTMGEPAGIGGEIALMAWSRRPDQGPPFVLIDDPDRIRKLARRIGVDAPVESVSTMTEGMRVFPSALPVLPIPIDVDVEPGRPDAKAASAVIGSIERAVKLVLDGEAGSVVTNPIHKETLYQSGFRHPGHTEFLGELAGMSEPPVMMLACPALRVVPVTIHLSLRKALAALSSDRIVQCGVVTAAALTRDFGIAKPVIAIAGLNPHAGEGGHLGDEERTIIQPAIDTLKSMGVAVSGPYPADTMFHEEARRGYDAALCMYHDQALIPIKTLDFHGGVNVTMGLPLVRTSPDHGTAFDIAGTGKANPASLINALAMAAEMMRHRMAGVPRPALA